MKPEEIVKVVQAYIDGKSIQASNNAGRSWVNATSPSWGFSEFTYRIKPYAPVAWANVFSDGSYDLYKTATKADIARQESCLPVIETVLLKVV